jgi:hypothetical protein
LGSGKEIHGKTRNMRNTENRKGRSRKDATTSNRKRSAIAVRTLRGKSRGRREDKAEESEDI